MTHGQFNLCRLKGYLVFEARLTFQSKAEVAKEVCNLDDTLCRQSRVYAGSIKETLQVTTLLQSQS